MALQVTHRKGDEVPAPGAFGRVNEELENLKAEMRKLGSGMVLELETDSEKAVRGAKMLITKAGTQLGTKWQHWSVGSKVFTKPADPIRRRGRRPKAQESA